jgi:hypothetical protein
MKSLNDSLREEFEQILQKPEITNIIVSKNLDLDVLMKAFEVLLWYKYDSDLIDKARGEFENFLINYFKNQNNKI